MQLINSPQKVWFVGLNCDNVIIMMLRALIYQYLRFCCGEKNSNHVGKTLFPVVF